MVYTDIIVEVGANFMKTIHITVLILMVNLVSCGDSYNSRVFQGNGNFNGNLQACKPGCYGIPQEWYDLGLILDADGNPLAKADPTIKKHGKCFFKVCSDPDSSYTKDALDWVDRFGGEVVYDDSDIVKCDSLKSIQSTSSFGIHESSIDYQKEPGC